MTLGTTQPLTEMSTRNLPGGLTTLWASTASYQDIFTFFSAFTALWMYQLRTFVKKALHSELLYQLLNDAAGAKP
jgi:hypothetical protein